ncbi:MAG TPA: gliding motility-associated C-terminal domain-containing protein [Ohtaekwangia sp.]
MNWRLSLFLLFCPSFVFAQQIVDSCFLSVSLGRFTGSDDIQNTCWKCTIRAFASDMMEWDPTQNNWIGKLDHNTTVDLPPPVQNCLTRAIWIGGPAWTPEGEGVALRLDKPLEAGKSYDFTFTYAADGGYSEEGFAPVIFTHTYYGLPPNTPAIVDTLPRAFNSWETNTLTFTATQKQHGHTWIILLAYDGSGTLLSNCKQSQPFPDKFLPDDLLLCEGDSVTLSVPDVPNMTQEWSDQSTGSSLTVDKPGEYSVEVNYFYCSGRDTTRIFPRDCDVRLTMPNVFSPNFDEYNERFIPIETNYVSSGHLTILNRWGEILFKGDVFSGWDGRTKSRDASTGVYYYKVDFSDEKGRNYQRLGIVSLLR